MCILMLMCIFRYMFESAYKMVLVGTCDKLLMRYVWMSLQSENDVIGSDLQIPELMSPRWSDDDDDDDDNLDTPQHSGSLPHIDRRQKQPL